MKGTVGTYRSTSALDASFAGDLSKFQKTVLSFCLTITAPMRYGRTMLANLAITSQL
jgi:hypothetical protein